MNNSYYEKTGFILVKVSLHKGIGYKLVATNKVIESSKDTVTVGIDTDRTGTCQWYCVPKTAYFENFYKALEQMQACTEGDNN